ncbi:MAG: hypothetical protein WBF53_02180 [Litorimonas sp.]
MDARAFRTALSAHGIDREVGDAIIEYVDEQKSDLVSDQKLELELTKLRGELRQEISELRGELQTGFANHKTEMNRLVLGSSGVIGLLIVAMRFIPMAG